MSVELLQVQVLKKQKKKMSKKNLVITLFLLFFIVFNVIMFSIANIFCNKIFVRSAKTETDGYNIFEKKYPDNLLDYCKKEEVSINSKFGYKLYGTYFTCQKASVNTIIILHDIDQDRWDAAKYADIYIQRGYNVLLYDMAGFGKSGNRASTFGANDSSDLDKWVNYITEKNPGGVIGVHGDGLGATTALMHLSANRAYRYVKFYVVDSPYIDLKSYLKNILSKDYKFSIPIGQKILLFYMDKIAMMRLGFSFNDVSPAKSISGINTPVLFIAGSKDTITPVSMTKALYKAKNGKKDIYITNSLHDNSYNDNVDAYTKKINSFLDANLK